MTDFGGLLRVLAGAQVEFDPYRGSSRGFPRRHFERHRDLDIVYRRSSKNVARLVAH